MSAQEYCQSNFKRKESESTAATAASVELSCIEKNEFSLGFQKEPETQKSPAKKHHMEHGLTSFNALASYVKAMIGSGVLGMPLAFYNGGLWTSFILSIIIAFINLDCLHMLVQTSRLLCESSELDLRKNQLLPPTGNGASTGYTTTDEKACVVRIRMGIGTAVSEFTCGLENDPLMMGFGNMHTARHIAQHVKTALDYADVAELALQNGPVPALRKYAKLGRYSVNAFILMTQLGLCCIYFVFIADNLKQHLGKLAAVANLIIASSLGIILQFLFQDTSQISQLPAFNSWSTLPLFFGTTMLSFEGIAVVLPIEKKMIDRKELTQWNGVINTGFILVVCAYIAFGFFGYGRFGSNVMDSVTLNLPNDEPLYQSVKLLCCIALFITYGVQFYVAVEIVSPFFQKKFSHKKTPSLLSMDPSTIVDYACRFSLVLLTFLLAELIPHLGLFLSLVGSLATTTIGTVFPPLLWNLSFEKSHWGYYSWRLYKNLFIGVVSIVGFLTGTYSAVRDIIAVF